MLHVSTLTVVCHFCAMAFYWKELLNSDLIFRLTEEVCLATVNVITVEVAAWTQLYLFEKCSYITGSNFGRINRFEFWKSSLYLEYWIWYVIIYSVEYKLIFYSKSFTYEVTDPEPNTEWILLMIRRSLWPSVVKLIGKFHTSFFLSI
jgi:hypothetical protein